MARGTIPMTGTNEKVAEHNLYDFRQINPATGNIWFANSGGTASTGYSPSGPKLTLALAQTAATASNGDTIFAAEGHAETIIGAAGLTLSKAGITYIGLGNGRARPT